MADGTKTKKIILCGLFAGLSAVFSQISIFLPFSPVPINLALMSVFIAGGILGGVGGSISQLVYLLLGIIGLPVFAGFTSGFVRILGPTGGYLITYPLVAFIVGWLSQKKKIKSWLFLSMLLGTITCYAVGTIWFSVFTKTAILKSFLVCVCPFVIGDMIKILVSYYVITATKKILPT